MSLALRGVRKHFGELRAVDGVDLDVGAGEVLALLGENGAGKSTLMRMVHGLLRPDAGQMTLGGRTVPLGVPQAARAAGIAMVFQQFSLIPAFTVAENLMLAWPRAASLWWRRRGDFRSATEGLRALAPELDVDAKVADLTVGQMQLVELAKALNLSPHLLILDEPTSVLGAGDSKRLWQAVRAAAARGAAVVLITHKLDEVEAHAQRVAVMRQGRIVDLTEAVHDRDRLVASLMGAQPKAAIPAAGASSRGAVSVSVRGLRAEAHGRALVIDALDVNAGEILGIGGVTGQAQDLFARILVGLAGGTAGQVTRHGAAQNAAKIAFIPEQPAVHGCVASASLAANLVLLEAGRLPFWKPLRARRAAARTLLSRFDVRPPDPSRLAGTLSGGNLQKLVIARELGGSEAGAAALVVACYPTMGLDLAATAAVMGHLRAAAFAGAAVVWVGEDVDLLLAHAHRIAIFHAGHLQGPVPVAETSRAALGAWMVGAAA